MNATIEFNDIEYQMSHGRSPRGRGSWAFSETRRNPPMETIIWTAGGLTYTEAKKWMRQYVRNLNPPAQGFVMLYAQP